MSLLGLDERPHRDQAGGHGPGRAEAGRERPEPEAQEDPNPARVSGPAIHTSRGQDAGNRTGPGPHVLQPPTPNDAAAPQWRTGTGGALRELDDFSGHAA